MNVLCIGAHHDDIELGCGGTVGRLVEQGHRVWGIVLTDSETHCDILGLHRPAEQALAEAKQAADILGLSLTKLPSAPARNGELRYDVQVMRQLERLLADQKIEMVFSHWSGDLNTDHHAAAKLSVVACRHVNCHLMFRSNWYQPSDPFNGTVYVDISRQIDRKRIALTCYAGEIRSRQEKWMRSILEGNSVCGAAVNVEYAECFQPVRLLMPIF